MPGLRDGYGLVIGTKSNYFRDDPDNFGRYYHGNLEILANGIKYHCAIDVDPKNMPDGVEWRIVTLSTAQFADIQNLPNGWHDLASTSTSGALDYARSMLLHPIINIIPFVPWSAAIISWLSWIRWHPTWSKGRGTDALLALEGVIDNGKRFYVFGEPFANGSRVGVHNVHQNQGDPVGGGHDAENAIWQDGGTIVEKEDSTLVAFLNKFKTQSYVTDGLGHPVTN
jgi:hypothetical protein